MFLTPTYYSPLANPLFFCKFMSPNNSIRWPSVVSSPQIFSSKFPVSKSFQSFISISSPLYHDRWVFVPDHSTLPTTIIKSFTSRAAAARDESSSIGEKLPVCASDPEHDDDDRPRLENMPQLDAVVTVLCTMVEPDFSSPWRKEQEEESYACGLILSGRRVLTTAHSVEHHTLLKVMKHKCDESYAATMLAIAPEYDLAILTVNDDEFWKGVKPVEFGEMPSPGDKVTVSCYQEDGDYVRLMTARVSRLGMTRYSFWGTKLLAFQINVGWNCGGPAFDERCKCVGLLLQSEANESDFIPAEVIKHLIQDYDRNGEYTGLPLLGIKWQKMENPYLRMLMNMEHDQQGVLVTEVKPNYPESVILKPYDVILSIDGTNISNDGTG